MILTKFETSFNRLLRICRPIQ